MESFADIKNLFSNCQNQQDRYQKLIELGRTLSPLASEFKTEENLVKGCQSIVYLHTEIRNGKIYFQGSSEALISAGLVALLIRAYQGKSPEFILKTKPTFLEELQIPGSLSPSRSNGLAHMVLRMQQDALKFLVHI